MQPVIHDVRSSLITTAGERAAQFSQEIPDWYIDDLKERRKISDAAPIGDLLHICDVPVWKVEEWMAQGFNIYSPEVTGQQIVARLERDSMDVFKVTSRSL